MILNVNWKMKSGKWRASTGLLCSKTRSNEILFLLRMYISHGKLVSFLLINLEANDSQNATGNASIPYTCLASQSEKDPCSSNSHWLSFTCDVIFSQWALWPWAPSLLCGRGNVVWWTKCGRPWNGAGGPFENGGRRATRAADPSWVNGTGKVSHVALLSLVSPRFYQANQTVIGFYRFFIVFYLVLLGFTTES